ncbi:hypothetical protein B0I35DRAFT_482020 [Stachybotrys elegans]|uniref:Uncharacterized protein n=1 Tax=Stachybotrys elegans TaxID=80388 RepID=A0A8K0WN49_9HYPO|nr:hypothetical protein B0I35DRAFT_482020 [Stachybotrys elegans]
MQFNFLLLAGLLAATSVGATPLDEPNDLQERQTPPPPPDQPGQQNPSGQQDQPTLSMFDGRSGSGETLDLTFQPGRCRNFPPEWRNRMSSFSKPQNSRCTLYSRRDCRGNRSFYQTDMTFICSVRDGLAERANSFRCQ